MVSKEIKNLHIVIVCEEKRLYYESTNFLLDPSSH